MEFPLTSVESVLTAKATVPVNSRVLIFLFCASVKVLMFLICEAVVNVFTFLTSLAIYAALSIIVKSGFIKAVLTPIATPTT